MIPNAFKQIPARVLSTLAIPVRPLKRPARAVRSIVATICVRYGNLMSDPNTQGDFNLPRELRRPFFLAAYMATLAIAAYYGLHWVRQHRRP